MNPALRAALLAVLALGSAVSARAQTLPSEPVVLGNGRLTISGDVSASYGCAIGLADRACGDDTAYFNYTDYEHSAIRLLRIDVTASLNAGNHVTLLGELRSENVAAPRPYALYVRIRPWTKRAFDIEAGRIPPTFGAFARRTYANDNLLIGYPLAYQYLTSLRADAVPGNADELIRMRGRGWLSSFSVGNTTPDRGLPLASGFRWDTGVLVHAASDVIDGTAAVTTGTVSNPLFRDDNSGRQLAGRVALRPTTGLVVGASGARGPFLTDTATRSAVGDGGNSDFTQTAWGADVEYSRDYYLIRAETVVSEWRVPAIRAPFIDTPLRAVATYVEGRYKIRPGLYAAARIDHLGFNQIVGRAGPQTWDAPVTRLEIGGGYSIQRNLLVKASYQHNTRDGGRVRMLNFGAAQIVFWF